jgi:hypothetical protein
MVVKLQEELTELKFEARYPKSETRKTLFREGRMTLGNNPLSRRCPRLGGPVGFKYCMSGEGDQPCAKVVDCWWETFDIVRYLRDNLSADQFDRLLNARPRPKVASLVELIAQAQKRQDA